MSLRGRYAPLHAYAIADTTDSDGVRNSCDDCPSVATPTGADGCP